MDVEQVFEKQVEKLKQKMAQDNSDTDQMKQKIGTFIDHNRKIINESNNIEFLESPYPETDGACARVNVNKLDRNVQMRLGHGDQAYMILDRSNTTNISTNKPTASSQDKPENKASSALRSAGLLERIEDISEHLGVIFVPNTSFTLPERIKVLEDTLINLERDFPTWSFLHFNQPSRSESMQRPLIRYSKHNNGDVVKSIPQNHHGTANKEIISEAAPATTAPSSQQLERKRTWKEANQAISKQPDAKDLSFQGTTAAMPIDAASSPSLSSSEQSTPSKYIPRKAGPMSSLTRSILAQLERQQNLKKEGNTSTIQPSNSPPPTTPSLAIASQAAHHQPADGQGSANTATSIPPLPSSSAASSSSSQFQPKKHKTNTEGTNTDHHHLNID
ncbi:hypothetical protein H4219_002494 [Mycoemilia scoparia]|uniref:Uncharacterized protein n=1 Tax=Mycoemilia scoparia TaxID=417184 RepID=A0A9W7ZY69_9FUNG|nr:hypothetical protein H4219_002494 [Mycoemilia scoparia]